MRTHVHKRGVLAFAFGAGLIVSSFCPTRLLITALAVVVLLLGISCCRARC
ncbi:MAG: hypothetical protein LBQ48_06015 [Oscillospiraceae bacterium]|nr:hypothetical protein [Oscillospiraceae bacterium]